MSRPVNGMQKGINEGSSAKKESARLDEITPDFIEALRNGDTAVFDVIVKKHTARIHDYVSQWLDRKEDAEEVTQEVFMYLWERREKFDRDSVQRLYEYIYTAAKFQAIRTLRQKDVFRRYSDYAKSISEDYADSPDEIVNARQTEHIIEKALKRMPKARSAAYDMKFNKGLSYKEIAHQLNISESTARSHIQYALNDIKSALVK